MRRGKDSQKLKIVMICHFSNPEVRANLSLDSRVLYSLVRRFLLLPQKDKNYGDIAPWDTNIIAGLKERSDIELYVISAHSGLKKRVVSFASDNINYFFVRCDEATFLKHIIPSPQIWLKLNPMRKRVKRIVDSIEPDIVLLFGAENAYISSTILGLEQYPRMIMCQTIYNNPKRKEYSKVDKYNAYVERKIFAVNQYFSLISDMHRDMLLGFRPDAITFHWEAATPLPDVQPIVHKKYDFVNFALNMSSKKGFHDSLKALAIVKEQYPHVKLNLTGGCTSDVKDELLFLIDSLNLCDNVEITPFFAKQEDLFQHLQKSRFAVLPCKMDYVAGTMIQSMHYGLPLVVYETSGTPSLNSEGDCVLIARNSDIADLAKKMLLLLNNAELAEKMAIKAKHFSDQRVSQQKVVNEIIDNSRALVNHITKGEVIPAHLIF